MVPIIFVAYGHVERLNILNACSKFASAIDRLATIPEQTQRISCFFILTLNIDTINNNNCLGRVESPPHSHDETTRFGNLQFTQNPFALLNLGRKSTITGRAAQYTALLTQNAKYF